MAKQFSSSGKAQLRKFLTEHLSLSELKNLAFDIGVNHELFPHETIGDLSRELVAHCERKGTLLDLVSEALKHHHDDFLIRLLGELPASAANPMSEQMLHAEKYHDAVTNADLDNNISPVRAWFQEFHIGPIILAITGNGDACRLSAKNISPQMINKLTILFSPPPVVNMNPVKFVFLKLTSQEKPADQMATLHINTESECQIPLSIMFQLADTGQRIRRKKVLIVPK